MISNLPLQQIKENESARVDDRNRGTDHFDNHLIILMMRHLQQRRVYTYVHSSVLKSVIFILNYAVINASLGKSVIKLRFQQVLFVDTCFLFLNV